MTDKTNQRIVLASRPVGAPTAANFRIEQVAKPVPAEGEVLLRNIYLSLDPYMRGRMSDAASYADPVAIDDVMVGGAVCQVEASNHPDYEVGEWVLTYQAGWQQYALADAQDFVKLGKHPEHPSYALGIMGMPGFTAYVGLLDIGEPKPGETVVVAAATGPVGATVGQIAKIKGCRAVGIAGSAEKCRHAVEVLGFDACIDHRAPDFAAQLAAACNDGIDVYFENVGGKVFDSVIPLLNAHARIPLCGLVSQYNATELPQGPDRLGLLMVQLLVKRIKVQGFIIFDGNQHRYPAFAKDMQQWLSEGKIHYREQLEQGLANAPQQLINLLEGKNFGKVVIQVNPPL
ncbi:NADP-dependent oxidoreductase [Shewanella mangrovi]|uniref:NADP-dependent oxidoreductase n=1 Tax=Shewanella mangrovi TaxID=1515746 RepID=A0A094JDK8_9GAMM|nr:NADP-dependent oxidoreductase [Shewanella mangrovi]KFZ37990.1 NADP-dependent oxidoreductase [Shewanella mangrovi]